MIKKDSPEAARKLLDSAVDLDQVIVLTTESLHRHLSVDPEADKSLQKIEDRALEQAEVIRNVESHIDAPTAQKEADAKNAVETEPSILVAGPALPLDPSRTKPVWSSRASRKKPLST
jgi:hypothetical protein